MDRVAFYAPMKPPGHPVPSGDRQMARSLMAAIGARAAVDLVSTLRIYDGCGNGAAQADLRRRASAEIRRIATGLRGGATRLWVSYHNYYKAPDLIGPAVCARLGLPYILIEASRARSRLNGPWAGFAAAAEAASDAADLIFYLTGQDRAALDRDRPASQRLVHLAPFLPRDRLPEPADTPSAPARIFCAAMMRPGDKLASYRIVADTLGHLTADNWRLDIAGDGPARDQVAALMAPFGDRVRFLGRLGPDAMARAYRDAALFFWPGVHEAFGMVYLEAQAAGLPVVAQDRSGVRDVLAPGRYPPPEAGPAALARDIATLLASPAARRARAAAARGHIARHHLIGSASACFWSAAAPLIGAGR